MVFRVREKDSFKTKIGVSVRENVLEMMNGIIGNVFLRLSLVARNLL